MADPTPVVTPPNPLAPPVKPQSAVARGAKAVLDWARQPEKSHAIAVLLGGLAAKSAYTKLIVGVVLAFLGVSQ